MPNSTYRAIASRLILSIYVWATACALAVTGIQVVYSYYHVRAEFEAELQGIVETSIPLLSVSLWDIELEAVRQQLEAIVKRKEIGFIRVNVSTGQTFTHGDAYLAGRKTPHRFDIPAPQKIGPPIGTIEIYESREAFDRELEMNVVITMLSYGVLTAIICTLVAALLKRQLEQPLRQIAAFVGSLTPDNLTTPLTLDRPPGHRRDEIDLVVDGFRVLQDGIHGHIANLDQLVAQRTQELEQALASIRYLSTVDPLTSSLNRRTFDERMAQEIGRSERYERPLTLVFCDVDHFKPINDQYGHPVGDEVLKAVARELGDGLRNELDSLYRFGGEEFVVLLPETAEGEAVVIAERLRLAVAQAVPVPARPDLRVTASFGVAQWQPGETTEQLVARADALLYLAKEAGRNQTFPRIGPLG